MLHVPARFATILVAFAPVFVQARTWQHAQMLLLGALLVPGQRTVCSILRIIGLRRERRFVTYQRVLNRAVWDSRLAARLLLKVLVETFVPPGPVLLGIDDSIERRRGKQISAYGMPVDRNNNVFLLEFSGTSIGRRDAKTGLVTIWLTPTPGSRPTASPPPLPVLHRIRQSLSSPVLLPPRSG